MTDYPSHRYLFDVRAGNLVDAQIFDKITALDIADWKATWKPEIDAVVAGLVNKGVPRHLWPQSHHWNWENKAPPSGVICERGYAIRCQSRLQGLMVAKSSSHQCRIPEQAGANCVYVDYLEAAPWNQRQYTASPLFTLVGTVLIVAAIHQSIDEGLKGRFALHSLPQSDAWYAGHLGMVDLGLDPSRHDGRLKYFEATAEVSKKILNGVKFP